MHVADPTPAVRRALPLYSHDDSRLPRTGLRISEAISLQPNHIDSQRMVIRVEQGKGQKDRYVMCRRNCWTPYATGGGRTVPEEIADIAFQNKPTAYDILFRATAETLTTIAADPQHLGAEIGFFAVLHSWGQTLLFHPHLHCVVPGGGLSPDGKTWISNGWSTPSRPSADHNAAGASIP